VSDIVNLDASFADNILEGLLGASNEVSGERLELSPRERLVEVRGAILGEREVGKLDACRRCRGQFLLRLLRSFFQTLQGNLVLADVNTVDSLKRLMR
jgi:NAD-specific glutamate dehydrogenase